MAQRIQVIKTDDLDPTAEATQTVDFGLDGTDYEIDLTDANARRLRDALAEFVTAGRRAGKPSKPARPHVRRLHPEDARDIRVWVRKNGGTVADRGRIAERFIDAYYDNNVAAVR